MSISPRNIYNSGLAYGGIPFEVGKIEGARPWYQSANVITVVSIRQGDAINRVFRYK